MKLLRLMLALLPLGAIASPAFDAEQTNYQELTNAQEKEVKTIVLKTIASNPKLISQQLEQYKQDKITNIQVKDFALINQNSEKLFNENNNISFGNPTASITIVEFVDYSCKHCQDLTKNIKRTIKENPNIKLIIKELPILGNASTNAAKAILAAKKQGKYLKFQEYLNTTTDEFSVNNLIKAADELGLNIAIFKQDFNSEAIANYIAKNRQLAISLGIKATPTIILSSRTAGKIIPGNLSSAQISSALASIN